MKSLERWYDEKADCEVVAADAHDDLRELDGWSIQQLTTEVERLRRLHQRAIARGDWFRQAWANYAHCSVEDAELAYETLGDITESAEDRIRRARGQQRDRRTG